MKKLIIPFLFIACLILTACNHDDEPIMDYYVRYTAIAKPNAVISMSFSNEPGKSEFIQTSMPDGKFQYSVGPVNKGFKANLVVSYDGGGPVEFLSIEVAKGSEPFVLKRSGTKYFDLEYIIE
ncbi:hypothetical protein [Duncaniella sp.]|uniref:hypothetical protein n=1 Tax=Duncaniella sp. TaxID=2518496 RepID=UPI0023CD3CDB|nr:hypothetical protein [Duncaniella sp.]MDE5904923.1 hypothetical protein [Duncaniella sp.]